MIEAIVNKIIPLSVVDGPGARSVVFLQGCNLACIYCHNPETQRVCNNCAKCVKICPNNALHKENGKVLWKKEICSECDACIKICPNFSSPRVAKMPAMAVFDQIQNNLPFISGITVSGGECMLAPFFLTDLFCLSKKSNLSSFIDTNGTIDFSLYPDLLSLTDGVMIDLKSWDNDTYHTVTRGSSLDNDTVKKNILFLLDAKKLYEIRIVCFPMMQPKNVVDALREFLGKKSLQARLKLIAFRNFGVRGDFARSPNTSPEEMQKLFDYCRDFFYEVKVV
ncbi:MAG: YjjW family glycine radical enzyme activase [Elusimicrobiota bacterium]|jgi:pyruvate formate lyase activating enzyme|nr:YjjW family glycine radical enzyme activase [Elusimicrobiota bacterium]